MEKIVKNQPIRIEFGDYDNFATMTPIEILEYEPERRPHVLIRWAYPNDDRTIDLWHPSDHDVDFDSFGFKR